MPTILVRFGKSFIMRNKQPKFKLNDRSIFNIAVYVISEATSSAPMCSKMALHPERRWQEPWRYITYGLVHKDYSHLLKNIVGLAMAGLILEYYHKSWRVFLVYVAGVIVGGIGRINPVTAKAQLTPLVGSSGTKLTVFIRTGRVKILSNLNGN